jgi:hypothetical protein
VYKLKLKRLAWKSLGWLFWKIGVMRFRHVVCWRDGPLEQPPSVLMFADSERDFNCCVRDQVDRLDGKNVTTEP